MTTTPEPTSKGLPKRALIAIIVAAVVVSASALTAVAFGLNSGQGQSATTVPVANFLERPKVGVWKMESPFVADVKSGGSDATEQLGSIVDVAADQAIVVWTYSKDGSDPDKQQLTLINTKSGATLWTRSVAGSIKVVSTFGGPDIVVQGDHTLSSIDRSNGRTVSQSKAAVEVTSAGATSTIPADRILLTTKNTINLYATSDLTSALWAKGIPDSSSISGFSSDRIFTQKASYSLASGQKLGWGGALGSDITYIPGNAAWPAGGESSELLRFEGANSGGTIDRVSPTDGSSLWQIDIPNTNGGIAFDSNGLLVLNGHTLSKFSATDGKKIWSQSGYSGVESFGLQPDSALAQSSVDFAKSAGTSGLVALDPTTGKQLYAIKGLGTTASGSSDTQVTVPIGASADILYAVTNGGQNGSTLFAYDIKTGLERWRINKLYSNWYDFRILGGNLVATIPGLSVGASDLKDFGDHPALLGIG
jgi:hypothetical protein